jgi:MscS family membrane protein
MSNQTLTAALGAIADHLPEWIFKTPFLLQYWQWAGLLLIIIVGKIIDFLMTSVLVGIARKYFERKNLKFDLEQKKKALRPFGILAMGAFWWGTASLLGLPGNVDHAIHIAARFIVVGASVWGIYRLVDLFAEFLLAKAAKTESKFDDLLIPLIRKSIKIFIAVVGTLFVASNIGFDIKSILAGLGLGGLAFALAAQDTVKNLFGSLTLLGDRPFDVGDWVVIGDIEGTVETVGIRSSRIRTFYNSIITLPNGNLITANVDNLGKRKFRRWKTMVQVTYGTPPDTIEAFVEGIRELIRVHPYTRKDYFHVYLNAFGAHSLDILVYMFFLSPDWGTELRERHRIMMDIIRLANRLGVQFAFPTQTLYLTRAGESAGPPELPVRSKIERGMVGGRREARNIAAGELGGLDVVPGPVNFDLPPSGTNDGGGSGDGDG